MDRVSRWDALSSVDLNRFSPICPDFLIELRSKSDDLARLEEKMKMWLLNRAKLASLVDPDNEIVSVYRPDGAPEIHHHQAVGQGSEPIAGFSLSMARIWG